MVRRGFVGELWAVQLIINCVLLRFPLSRGAELRSWKVLCPAAAFSVPPPLQLCEP